MGVPGIDGGFVGVDVFFVLSGFLITRQLVRERALTGRIGFARFFARRVRRLLPLSALVLLCTLVASALLLSPFDLTSIAEDVGWSAGYLANFRFAISGEDYFAISPSPVTHYWSLAVEEQFYAFWPFLLAAPPAASTVAGTGRSRAGRTLVHSLRACLGLPPCVRVLLEHHQGMAAAGGRAGGHRNPGGSALVRPCPDPPGARWSHRAARVGGARRRDVRLSRTRRTRTGGRHGPRAGSRARRRLSPPRDHEPGSGPAAGRPELRVVPLALARDHLRREVGRGRREGPRRGWPRVARRRLGDLPSRRRAVAPGAVAARSASVRGGRAHLGSRPRLGVRTGGGGQPTPSRPAAPRRDRRGDVAALAGWSGLLLPGHREAAA